MAALPLAAQPLKVYSEFSRIAPSGEVVEVDRSDSPPREILSPAVPRNGFASYHIVATLPANTSYIFDIGQNPEGAVKATVYREIYDLNGIPEKLEPIELPYESKSSEMESIVVFWLDIWIGRDAAVRRIKVEPQLHIEGFWYTYPMEVRISLPIVPAYKPLPIPLSPPEVRSDADVQSAVRTLLCAAAAPKATAAAEPSIRAFIYRNLEQDLALARNYYPREETFKTLFAAAKVKTAAEWCAATKTSPTAGLGAEWYLKVRDFLYRAALN
jgi:hypothetical protein